MVANPLPLVYGSERKDVLDAGACDHAEVGFVSIMNWGNLGDGPHTAVVYDDGIEFDRSTFDVVTTGEAFLRRRGRAVYCPGLPRAQRERPLYLEPTDTTHGVG